MCKLEIGIDTFSFCYTLTDQLKKDLIKRLKNRPGFQTKQSDYFSEAYEYLSGAFAEQGIKLQIIRAGKNPWQLFLTVHPTLLLGNEDRSALYIYEKATWRDAMKCANRILESIHLPYKIDALKLYRVDVTANLKFEDADLVQSYLRILKKGRLLPHYRLEWFRKHEGKAKDIQQANRSSYKQACKSAAFFAYDKTAQLVMIDRLPNGPLGKRVLRLEVQLRRKGMKKWISQDDMDDSQKVIKRLYAQGKKIILWYLVRMGLGECQYVRYEAAVMLISGVKGQKMRDRMLYLLRKTSDSRDLSAALDKLKSEYGLKAGQVKRVLNKFRKLGISPITLPNTEKRKRSDVSQRIFVKIYVCLSAILFSHRACRFSHT